jgi:Ca2+-binding RTX toxin-like protein
MRRHIRQILIFAAFAVLAVGMSGCVIIKSNSSTQLDGIGAVQVTTTFCASDTDSNAGYSPPDSDCQGPTKGGNSNNDASNAGAGSLQLLLAYRIPKASAAPDTIVTTNPGGGSAVTFSQNSSYGAELQGLAPAGSSQQWVGYVSNVQGYTEASANQYFTVAPEFTLLQQADGAPYEGPFNYRVIVGFRRVDGSNPASRAVDCGAAITTMFNDGPGDMICADSPASGSISSNLSQQTQDLGILDAPGTQSVNQGKVARVKFQLDYAGDGNPAPDFDLSATTNIPGATALPSTPLLTPEEGSNNQVRVIARVPVNTAPGHYDVNLVASLPTGETRTSTHDLLVTPTTVRCNAFAPTIAGTREDDVLVGTAGPDVIAAYAGNDEVLGLSGDDLICTGKGDDTIRGGSGDDRIAGRRGNDLLTGGSGRNLIDPGPGKDRMIQ